MMQTPKIGIHYNVPLEEYLGWDALGQTSLKAGVGHAAPAAAIRASLAGEDCKVTDDMALGIALDCAFYEPAAMLSRVAVWKKKDGKRDTRCKAYKDWLDENAHKAKLTEDAYKRLQLMDPALRKHPEVARLIVLDGYCQISLVWKCPETGLLCKARLDYLHIHQDDELATIRDLKKSNTRALSQFWRTYHALGYHIQLGWYGYGVHILTGIEKFDYGLLVQEDAPPYWPRLFKPTQASVMHGLEIAQKMLGLYADALKTDNWGSYDPINLDLPPWGYEVDEETDDEATPGIRQTPRHEIEEAICDL